MSGEGVQSHRDILTPHRNLNVGSSCDWGVDNSFVRPSLRPSVRCFSTGWAIETTKAATTRNEMEREKKKKKKQLTRTASAAEREWAAITFVFVNAIADHISVRGSAPQREPGEGLSSLRSS